MKRIYFILSMLIVFICYSCNKDTLSTLTASPIDTSHSTTPVVSNPVTIDTISYYDTLRILTQQGSTWKCIRYDTIYGYPAIGTSSFNTYQSIWESMLPKGDTIWVGSDSLSKSYSGIKRYDSSFEIYLVNGKISLGNIRKIFASFPYSASTVLLQINSNNMNDTCMFSILTINNTNRNLVDTEYIYLSKDCFAIFPQCKLVPATINNTFSNYTTDWSLPNMYSNLSSLTLSNQSFNFNGTIIKGDMILSHSSSSSSGNGMSAGNANSYFSISQKKGILIYKLNTNWFNANGLGTGTRSTKHIQIN